MKNRSTKKGFTMTELIIIVAVIGILATIVVASFMTVNDNANSKADANTVAAINGSLDSGKAIDKKLTDVKKVRDYLIASGFSADSLAKPQTVGEDENDKYCFVWDMEDEVVKLIKILDNSVVYPEEYKDDLNIGNWYFLDRDAQEPDCSDAAFPSAQKEAKEYFAAKINAMSTEDKQKSYIFAAKIHMEYVYDGVTYPIVANESERTQTVYAVYNGALHGTDTNPLGQFTIVQGTLNYLYNTNQSSVQAWIMKYLPIGGTSYVQVEGLYSNPLFEDTADGNIYRIYTRLGAGVSTTGETIRENRW